MIILEGRKLIEAKFRDEQEIEDLVLANSEHFFGPASVLISKKKIKTRDGFGTIPDGFAVDLASRVWYVIEAELGHHNVWAHIAPQVAKQLLAASRPETRQLLTEIIVQMIASEPPVKEKFDDEGIKEIDIRKVLGEIFEKPPIIGMPIDSVSRDLRDWAETLKNDVRLWIVRKYVEFGNPNVVAFDIPEEYRPVLDTTDRNAKTKSGIRTYEVSVSDLMVAGLLAEGQQVSFSYKPRGGQRKTFKGTLSEDSSLEVLGGSFSSLSYAALACMQEAGSTCTTVNGWTCWRTRDGKPLSQLRDDYLAKKEEEAEQAAAADG